METSTLLTYCCIYFGLFARAEAEIEVWKSPTCGCCQAWVDYMRDNGFEVIAYNTEEMVPVKLQLA